MNTILLPARSHRRVRRAESSARSAAFRSPHYQCEMHDDVLKLVVYVPGVEAAGVEITTRGPDLSVTARKRRVVRINWQALHLEPAQRDYLLNLRLGRGLDYNALTAELRDGILTIVVPKKHPVATDPPSTVRAVA